MGPEGDVRLTRVGERKLEINTDVDAHGIDAKNVYVGGVQLEFYIRSLIHEVLESGLYDNVSFSVGKFLFFLFYKKTCTPR